jgi:hypothetical protein
VPCIGSDFSSQQYCKSFKSLSSSLQDLFVVRHELAIMRLAAFMGITMLVGITGLFYTQLIGIITVRRFLM